MLRLCKLNINGMLSPAKRAYASGLIAFLLNISPDVNGWKSNGNFAVMDTRNIFLRHMAQTSPAPLALHITSASGNYLHDAAGRSYLDIIGGISVCNIGHCHPDVVAAINNQAR